MKKIYKFASIVTPVTIMLGSLSVYFAVSMQSNRIPVQSTNNDSDEAVSIYDKYEVFPELNQEDFYDKVKVIQGKGIIDKQMISKILNYIFDHMEVAEGDVQWAYKRIGKDNDSVIISVKWIAPNKVYSKNYKIDLKNV